MTAEQTKIAEESHVKAPWLNVYGVVPPHLDYPDCTMYEAVERCAETYPNHTAYVFMGRKTTYRAMAAEIDLCARALKATGVRPGDRITMAMPNCPQAVIMFYAINLVGATANMIHPLSSEKEIEFYLKESGSIFAVTLDQFYHKFEAIRQNVTLDNIILASIPDALSKPVRVGYMLTEGRKQAKIPKDAPVLRWNEFLRRGRGYHWTYRAERRAGDEAVILYSGGTTGVTKGIQLTNLNFNALGKQIIATNPMFRPGDKNAGGDAHVPWLRSGRVYPLHAGQRRLLYSGAPVYPGQLRKAAAEIPVQPDCRRPHAVRGAAAAAQNEKRGPELFEGCLFWR